MILAKRIARLEKLAAPIRENRIVLRYEGPGSENCRYRKRRPDNDRPVRRSEGRPAGIAAIAKIRS